MSDILKIILLLFYLHKQTLAAENTNMEINALIKSPTNRSTGPCVDFYFHLCGKYDEKNYFNASLKHKNLHNYAMHQYNTRIINLLDKFGRQKHRIGENCQALTEKVRSYFEACRKVNKINITRYLEEMELGPDLNWPILENENGGPSKWPHDKDFDVFYILGKLGSLGFTNVVVNADDNRNFWESTIVLRRFKANYSSFLENREKMFTVLSLMRIKNSAHIVNDVLETYKRLEDISEDKAKLNEASFKIRLGGLVKRYPNLNFTSFFMAFLGEQLKLDTLITLENPAFFQELNDKLWLLFDKSKLCNYIMMHYLISFDTDIEFNDMFCVDELKKTFILGINFLYYYANIDYHEKRIKPDVTEIFKNVVDMLRNYAQSHDLELTIYQIDSVIRSLAHLRLNIGYLPDNATCETIEKVYASLPLLDENNYYRNHLIMQQFKTATRFHDGMYEYRRSSEQPVAYNYHENMITLSYAYLIPPIYDFHYPTLAKYTQLGFILAHKLVETSSVLRIFRSKHKPLNRLHSAFECLKINPNWVDVNRRIKDTVATEVIGKVATLKYFNLQDVGSVPHWKKLFFYHVAQHFCDTDGSKLSYYLNRIVMDSEEFAQVFHCPEGSEMNPSEKCQIM